MGSKKMKKHHFNVFNIDELNDAIENIYETVQDIQEIKTQGYWSYGYDLPDYEVQTATRKLDDALDNVVELMDTILKGFLTALDKA